MKKSISVTLAVLVGTGVTAGGMWVHESLGTRGAASLASVESSAAAAAWAGLLYFVMITGVLANHLYGVASEKASAGQPFTSATQLIDSLRTAPRLWMALAISPFLFHAMHLVAGDAPNGATSLFFAFQNGFFWQAVFAGFQQKATREVTEAVSRVV